MLQVENREALLAIVGRRQIDIGNLYQTCALRGEQHLNHLTMLHIDTVSIEILVGSRYLDTTLPTAAAKEVACTGIVNGSAIDSHMIVVETGIHRTFCCTLPNTVTILLQNGAATATKTKADDD